VQGKCGEANEGVPVETCLLGVILDESRAEQIWKIPACREADQAPSYFTSTNGTK
jgi:hypothetical protein